MALSGAQIKQLQQALISAFPKVSQLDMFVRTALDENRSAIAGGNDLSEIVFHLIQWASAHGRETELIEKATQEIPGNPDLQRFAKSYLKTPADQIPITLPTVTTPPHDTIDLPVESTPQPFAYDVFLSHSSKDESVVRPLAERLREDGVRVWFFEWAIQPGDSIPAKIEEGLKTSHILLLCMSENAFGSDWVTLENQTFRFRDPLNKERCFLPLRLDDTPIKGSLAQFLSLDWRPVHQEQTYSKLLDMCCSSKPDEPPAFANSGPLNVQKEHAGEVYSVAISSDGKQAISGSEDGTLWVWDLQTGKCLAILQGHAGIIRSVALSANGDRAISGSGDKTLRVWDLQTGKCLTILKGHEEPIWSVALSSNGNRAISGSEDNILRMWDLQTGECLGTLPGHTDDVNSVAISSDDKRAISGSSDNTLRMWDLQTAECLATLEGHTGIVWSVAISSDGKRAISGSDDSILRVWDLQTGECLATLEGHTSTVYSVALSSDGTRAISGSDDNILLVWDLTTLAIKSQTEEASLRYTNAKVLLVGDSGVGKTGLALRLAENRFQATVSTDGAWASQISLPHDLQGDGIDREIWMWDFAGQSDYRLIHQLYMDETALAIFVFNPQQDNPFEGLAQWDRALQRASRRPFRKLLVAARCDRGSLRVSREVVEQFRQERGFGAYLETSASTGTGCEELHKAIVDHIAWETIPWTSSPRIFQLLKQEIIKLKDEGKALLRMSELTQQLEMRLPGEHFTLEELRAVVGLLAGPGIVWHLGFGDFVLLQPERINAYAAAALRKVRTHIDELGCISEEALIQGDLDYQDMRRLPQEEEEIVLRAMHQTFVKHGLCLKESTEHGVLLVFPSYFKRERPEQTEHPAIYVVYRFQGDLEEIYATLVVRLTHTALLAKKVQLWYFAADFQTPAGKRIGLKMIRKAEGAGELDIYFEKDVPDDTKVVFLRYVHNYILGKDQDAIRERRFVCPHCGIPVENQATVQRRLARNEKDILCVECEKRVPLKDLIEEMFESEKIQQRAQKLAQKAQGAIDNESRELILIGHAFAIAGEAGQIFRPTSNSDWGLDGEIEFKNDKGEASGRRVYLQLKSGDSYLYTRQKEKEEIFTIKTPRHAEYWQNHAYPVMLVIRTSDGQIRWMDISAYLKIHGNTTKQIVFDGEPFNATNLIQMRQRLLSDGL